MPSFAYTPGRMAFTGGEFALEPVFFTYAPGSMAYSGGTFDLDAQYNLGSQEIEAFRLNRLERERPIVNPNGSPTALFMQNWQRHCEKLEAQIGRQGQQITDLQALVAAIQAAQSTAAQAQQTANAAISRIDLANSYTDPTSVLTASSDGTVTIAGHDRIYDDGTRVAVDGGALTGYTEGQFVRVYYEDAAREGGAVEYQGSTSDVAQQGNTHVVGAVTIPAAGQPPSDGAGVLPPGFIFEVPFIAI